MKRVRQWHSGLSRFWRHVTVNMLIGVGISILLWSQHDIAVLREMEDAGIDWLIQMQWGLSPEQAKASFVFLEIDERTYRAWGEPFHVPREQLLKLIQHAVDGGASMVVVDIDLSKPGTNPVAAESFKRYFEAYKEPGRPPLILARFFRVPLEPHDQPTYQPRESFLDEAVAASPRLHWGSPLFVLDNDRLLRRWRLWEPVCHETKPHLMPSIQLLSVALLQDADRAVKQIDTALATVTPNTCGEPLRSERSSERLEIVGLELSTTPDVIAQRILYTLPWQLHVGEAYPISRQGTPVLSIRSALPITAGQQPVNSQGLRDRVVVIGASFADSRDLYFTPLGPMPGSMVLINAIHSLQSHGELQTPSWLIKLPIELLLILLMSFLFALLSSFWGMVVASAAVVILLLPLSFLYFRTGVWLDFAIPLVAVQIYQFAAEFKELKKAGGSQET